MICLAPHKCSCLRKLCVECLYEHEVDIKKHTIPITNFQERILKKLKESKLEETSELNNQRMAFKQLLSQSEQMLKKILEELSQLINQIYDWIEQENQSYLNFINKNSDLAQTSSTDLEKLVNIVEGTTLNDFNAYKSSYMKELDQTKNWWDQLINTFIEKSIQGIQKIESLIKEDEEEVYQMKEDLYEMLTYIQDIDETIYKKVFEIFNREKVSDILGFLSQTKDQKFYEYLQVKKITNVLRNIQNHQFSKDNYSSETYEKARQNLIKMMKNNKGVIDFIMFLVHLTSIEGKFIQCGSNALNLLVGMKVDIKNQSFQNIRIKNTSLIGANLVRCNLSGSEFDNVDISGLNLNGTQMFNCKWKDLKIHELNKLDGQSSCIRSVCISPDGNTLSSGSEDKSICLWDVKTGHQKAKFDGHEHWVMSVCFSPNGNILASGSNDRSIRLWNVKTGQQKAKFDGHTSAIMSVCFSPDGQTLASGSNDKSIRLWDVQTQQQKAKLDGHSNCINSVCFSPDGNTLASGSYDNSIRLWDVKTGQQKVKLDSHTHYVYSVCFSSDGNILLSGSNDNSIRLWDVKAGIQTAKLDGHSDYVKSVCFSPDGNTLASGSDDKSIRLWNVKTGQQKAKLDGYSGYVYSVNFSPIENTLASGSYDDSIRLWDVNIGEQQVKFDGHFNEILSVCFSPDGNTLASCSQDDTICFFDVKTGQEIKSFDKNYQIILTQFKALFQSNSLPISTNITTLRISKTPLFQAQGALILKGHFVNYEGYDLRELLKSEGSCIQKTYRKSDFDHYQTTIIITINIQYFFLILFLLLSLLIFTSKARQVLIFQSFFPFQLMPLHLFLYYENIRSIQCKDYLSKHHKKCYLNLLDRDLNLNDTTLNQIIQAENNKHNEKIKIKIDIITQLTQHFLQNIQEQYDRFSFIIIQNRD
ncbi:unnamed protein product [Paramecium pentaurelia]|uniref:EML-like second beta-propeller domain-containing protein n=1 Tax=Paramecium pentaurelia TaxID=43138 RepID=A0A8S1UU38_9CILI|nr:unnamed protein product [Paramecium pentaurelia]